MQRRLFALRLRHHISVDDIGSDGHPFFTLYSTLVCSVPRQSWRMRYNSAHILHNIAICHGCIFCCEILYLFATYSLSLENSSVFCIFVVIMLLKIKSLSIARKLLVYFFGPKSINNLLHRMFFWMVYMYDFLAKLKCWCMAKCLTEGWWWYPETSVQ